MFTGIVADVGEMVSSRNLGAGTRLRFSTALDASDFALGESIAVNGVCLTVDSIGERSFEADASPETLRRSNLGELTKGSRVNLERALRPMDRLGGHFVMGHVDAVGELLAKKREGDFVTFTFSAPAEVERYLVHKGSVAVDGVSLTVAEVGGGIFKVAAIPHTLEKTTLSAKGAGERVNMEADILGKYVEKLISSRAGNGGGLTMEKLASAGFLG
ncbi:riboflavin synthase [bacterium]|nr:MAG: riboflavin synthase [bacterium]